MRADTTSSEKFLSDSCKSSAAGISSLDKERGDSTSTHPEVVAWHAEHVVLQPD
jgi:hypothetical protein